MKNKIFAIAALLCMTTAAPCTAGTFWHGMEATARIGYNIGGTAPFGLPASIRSLEGYKLPGNSVLELDATKPINDQWSWTTGLRLESKDMLVDAKVKNYHMAMVQGENTREGMFTGFVHTEVRQWMATVPLQAKYRLSPNVSLRVGAYVSYLLSKSFTGNAYNGYLRIGTPTGPKLELGNELGTRGDYDFSKDMRNFQFGVLTGVDCHVYRRIGLYAEVNWGLTGIHKRSFKTIEQTLYPIFGSFGVTYRVSKK